MLRGQGSAQNYLRLISLISVVTLSVLFLLKIINQIEMPRDDAYISFVYAKNWAAGHGPVYNVGDQVEGYTNFLWVLLLAVLGKIGFNIPISAQMISIALSICIVFMSYFLTEELLNTRHSHWIALFPAAFITLNPSFIYWTLYSLETNLLLFILLICLMLFHFHTNQEKDSAKHLDFLLGFCLFLLSIVRFDGILLSGLIILGYVCKDKLNGVFDIQTFKRILIIPIIFYTIYTLWRLSFYGDLLPNTFYVKSGVFDYISLQRGYKYIRNGLSNSWGNNPYIGLIIYSFAIYQALIKRQKNRSPLLMISIGLILYVFLVGGDNLGYFRFILPSILISYILFAIELETILESMPKINNLVLLLVILLICSSLVVAAIDQKSEIVYVQTDADIHRMRIGLLLKETTNESTTVALIGAGIIKFYSERYSIDMLGLNDRDIAHTDMNGIRGMPGHEKYNSDSLLSRMPDIIITHHPREVSNYADLKYWALHETKKWYSHAMIVDLVTNPILSDLYEISSLDDTYGILLLKE